MYIALLWLIFGKSLVVSHLGMLPFGLGIGAMVCLLVKELSPPRLRPWAVLVFLVDPVLAAQLTLVSPDVPLAFFFLLGVYAAWRSRPFLMAVATIGLVLLSTRGMMVGFGLALFSLSLWRLRGGLSWQNATRELAPFLPAGLLGVLFLAWHYAQTGWIGYHPESAWASSFQRVGLSGFFRNGLIFGWRLLDYGRIVLWIGLFFGIWQMGRARWKRFGSWSFPMQFTFLLCVSMTLVSLPWYLLYAGLQGVRYLLPLFLSLSLLLIASTNDMVGGRIRPTLVLAMVIAGLGLGNLWVYPRPIAQAWDSTLAHLPYYALRQDMISILDREQIPLSQVGSQFPNLGPLELIDLNGRQDGFVEADLDRQPYIFYSNVMNDFTDGELQDLDGWTKRFHLRRGLVEVILYERPE